MEAFSHGKQLTGMRMFEVDETTNILTFGIGNRRVLAAHYAVKFYHSSLVLPQLTELLEEHHPCLIHHRQSLDHYFEIGLVTPYDLSWWDIFTRYIKANTGEDPTIIVVRTVDYFNEEEDPLLSFSVYAHLAEKD